MHLRFCCREAELDCGETRHPQAVMKAVGITFQHAMQQSPGEWWFWNCENVPERLPKYLSEINLDPTECIGFGLSREGAEKIQGYGG